MVVLRIDNKVNNLWGYFMKKVQLGGALYIEKRKSKTGNSYIALICDLGYTKKVISVNTSDIAELISVSVVELIKALEGEK